MSPHFPAGDAFFALRIAPALDYRTFSIVFCRAEQGFTTLDGCGTRVLVEDAPDLGPCAHL
jgi:hypothetical protein